MKVYNSTIFFLSIILGLYVSFLAFFMIEVLYAQILVEFVIDNISTLDSYSQIVLILFGGELISIVVSIIVSFIITPRIADDSIIKSSILSLLMNLMIWFSISFFSMFIFYPEIFVQVTGIEIFGYTPLLMVYFGIYVLNDVTLIWIYSMITYFIIYGFVLSFIQKPKKIIKIRKRKKKGKQRDYKW